MLALIAAVSFGAYSVLSRAQQRHYSPLNIATYSTLFGGLTRFLLTPAELARWNWEAVSAGAWAAVAYLVIFSTTIAYGIWQWGIGRIGADRALIYLYLITFVGVVSSVVLLCEGFSLPAAGCSRTPRRCLRRSALAGEAVAGVVNIARNIAEPSFWMTV